VADLHWFQYDVEWWEERMREFKVSAEDEGFLMRLVRVAWREKVPCTIDDHDDTFARILGAKWKKAMPIVRAHFTPDPENPGRLRCAWLSALYANALAKHESYQQRGRMGGRPPMKRPPPKGEPDQTSAFDKETSANEPQSSGSDSESSGSKPLARKNKAEGFSCGPSDHTTKTPALDGAHAPEGARTAGADDLRPRYYAWLRAEVDAWCAAHEDEARELGIAAMRRLDMPFETRRSIATGTAKPETIAMVRRHIVEDVRERAGLPDEDTWIADQTGAAA
jgi:hypothetical protein